MEITTYFDVTKENMIVKTENMIKLAQVIHQQLFFPKSAKITSLVY